MSPTTCIHFNGVQHDCCLAGIPYKRVSFDCTKKLPCLTLNDNDKRPLGSCAKHLLPTKEQVAAFDTEQEKAYHRLMRAIPLMKRIKKEHKGQAWSGIVECPECKGKLHLSHSQLNGHVWGKCETKDCLAWVE